MKILNTSKDFYLFRMERGQSTIEFIVACLVMIPFFFGIYYFSRYSDIKYSAIQASRYAAFERSWDPSKIVKTDVVIKEEVQVRFFMQNDSNKSISYQDKPTSAGFKDISLWSQADGKKLIDKPSDITLTWDDSNKFSTGIIMDKLSFLGESIVNLPASHIIKSQIEVPLLNISHFTPLNDINIKLPAAMAIGSGSWNASGAKGGVNSVCAKVSRLAPTNKIGDISSLLTEAFSWFEKSELKLGIILPDYVPPGSVRTNNSASPSSTPLEQQNPSGTAGDKGTEC